MNVNDALSVTQVNNYVKTLMEGDDLLRSVAIRGEISNFKRHSSGHLYFTLKDEGSEISAVMFRTAADRLAFAPRSGMRVVVYGRVSVYEAAGKYQIYVSAMISDGIGALHEQYLRLLEKLKAEGLFDSAKKRALPKFPKKIGIITSPTGAAVRDMINVTGRRYPSASILLCPALVQGADAPQDLCRALDLICAVGECDVIIIGRGGGSIEDLWAFNDEALVRAVAACPIPIISAVGHETDTTLCDFAADMRAPTPSAAAEQAVPDRHVLMQSVDERGEQMERAMLNMVLSRKSSVESYSRQISALSPRSKLNALRQKILSLRSAIDASADRALSERKMYLAGIVGRLEATNPLSVLGRGYGIATNADGAVVSSVHAVSDGDQISIKVFDGTIDAKVCATREG